MYKRNKTRLLQKYQHADREIVAASTDHEIDVQLWVGVKLDMSILRQGIDSLLANELQSSSTCCRKVALPLCFPLNDCVIESPTAGHKCFVPESIVKDCLTIHSL